MAANEIRVGDIGTKFQVTIKDGASVVDISSATSTKQIILKKPDGTKLTNSATFSSDGTNGVMYYTTVDGDLDVAGIWKLQGKVVITAGTFSTDIYSFKVHRNL